MHTHTQHNNGDHNNNRTFVRHAVSVIGNKQLNLRRWQLPGDIILWYGIEEICKKTGFQVQCLLKIEQMSFYGSICHAHEKVTACFNKICCNTAIQISPYKVTSNHRYTDYL